MRMAAKRNQTNNWPSFDYQPNIIKHCPNLLPMNEPYTSLKRTRKVREVSSQLVPNSTNLPI